MLVLIGVKGRVVNLFLVDNVVVLVVDIFNIIWLVCSLFIEYLLLFEFVVVIFIVVVVVVVMLILCCCSGLKI